jgi:hypothetical protein
MTKTEKWGLESLCFCLTFTLKSRPLSLPRAHDPRVTIIKVHGNPKDGEQVPVDPDGQASRRQTQDPVVSWM